jgi:hypothetical protein
MEARKCDRIYALRVVPIPPQTFPLVNGFGQLGKGPEIVTCLVSISIVNTGMREETYRVAHRRQSWPMNSTEAYSPPYLLLMSSPTIDDQGKHSQIVALPLSFSRLVYFTPF